MFCEQNNFVGGSPWGRGRAGPLSEGRELSPQCHTNRGPLNFFLRQNIDFYSYLEPWAPRGVFLGALELFGLRRKTLEILVFSCVF